MPIPDGRHTDWPWPFSYIPRRWTAKESDNPPVPVKHSKGIDQPDDIPPPGHWVLMRSDEFAGRYFALTTRKGWHFRIGTWRYDYVDGYYTFPTFTIKRLSS